MKRLAFAIAGLPRPSGHRVGGDLGHERPRINVMRWKGRTGDRERAGLRKERTCAEEILIIGAHDPDSAITEIEVWFDEGGTARPCFAIPIACRAAKQARPAGLEIGSFTEPATYTIPAVDERGDAYAALHSRVYRLETEVLPPA